MIRQAEVISRDVSGIQSLIQIGVDSGHLLPRPREEIEEVIRQRHFYVADQGAWIAGCASLEIYSQRLAEVRSVAVLPTFRRTKLGTLLVQRCIEEAVRLGVQEVLAVTDQRGFMRL